VFEVVALLEYGDRPKASPHAARPGTLWNLSTYRLGQWFIAQAAANEA